MSSFQNFVIGCSTDVIRQMSYLYFPEGARIIDITWGTGVFGKGVDRRKYQYVSSDLHTGGEGGKNKFDFAALPYPAESADVILSDIPWGCHQFYSHAQDGDRVYDNRYGGNGGHPTGLDPDETKDVPDVVVGPFDNVPVRWGGTSHKLTPPIVWKMFEDSMRESKRIVKDGGLLVVKCQDGMQGNKQIRYEIKVWNYAVDDLGLTDVAKYVQYYPGNRPCVAKQQKNPRNCVSAYWVFRKPKPKGKRKTTS